MNRNISQLIVTLAFFYSSIVCHFKALELFNDQELLMSIFLWFCALTSFCGALRYQIAKIIYKLRDLKKNASK